jgi:hypothetical protein
MIDGWTDDEFYQYSSSAMADIIRRDETGVSEWDTWSGVAPVVETEPDRHLTGYRDMGK